MPEEQCIINYLIVVFARERERESFIDLNQKPPWGGGGAPER